MYIELICVCRIVLKQLSFPSTKVQKFYYTTTNKSEQLYERQFMVSQSNRQSSSRVTIRKQNYKNEFLTIRIEICFRNPGFNVKCAIDTSLRLLFHYFRRYFSKQNCLTPFTCGTLVKQRTPHFEVWTKSENCKFSNNSEYYAFVADPSGRAV